mmetsp:Transcript_23235/g.44564  ORF Transcript_23235/g.44564 Transcript_23235/m.44564 type:complete len:610 (-) Transcript_23235:76-1905(-)
MSADTVFSFGKHRGKTFQYVVENNRGYAAWCLEQKNLRSQLRDFAAYVRKSGLDLSSSQAASQASQFSQFDAMDKVPQSQTDGGLLGLAVAPCSDDATQPHSSLHSSRPQAATTSMVQNSGQKSGEAGGYQPGPGTTSSDATQPNTAQSMGSLRPPSSDCARPGGESTSPFSGSHATAACSTSPACKAEPPKEPVQPFPHMGANLNTSLGTQPAATPTAQAETSLPTQAEPADASVWSTGDDALDAFLRATVDPANLTKLASVSAIRRTAVAKLLQARIASVKNPPAYITKVIDTAVQGEPEQRQPSQCQDSSQPRDPTTPQRLPSGTILSPDQAVAQQQQQQQQQQSQAWTQIPQQQGATGQGQFVASQVPPWVVTQESQQGPLQQSAMFQPATAPAQQQGAWACMASQGAVPQPGTQMTSPQSLPMQPGAWACMPTQQTVSGDALQATQQPAAQVVCMPSQGGCTPGMMVTQMQGPATEQGPMMVQQQPGGQWQAVTPWGPRGPCPAAMTPEPVPQLTPWQRVLNHLESKGIPFSTVSSCHIDTRRDILKEVFGCREPLLRAQAEMDWMKNKGNAHGTAPQSCKRSRDGLAPMAPGRAAGVSYIMQR